MQKSGMIVNISQIFQVKTNLNIRFFKKSLNNISNRGDFWVYISLDTLPEVRHWRILPQPQNYSFLIFVELERLESEETFDMYRNHGLMHSIFPKAKCT